MERIIDPNKEFPEAVMPEGELRELEKKCAAGEFEEHTPIIRGLLGDNKRLRREFAALHGGVAGMVERLEVEAAERREAVVTEIIGQAKETVKNELATRGAA